MRRIGVSWLLVAVALVYRLVLPVVFVLAPVLAWQGIKVKTRVPRFPEAAEPEGFAPGEVSPPLRVTLLGESTAAGVGVERHRDGLAGHLAAAVAGLTGREVRWRVVARPGATARAALREFVPRLREGGWSPDVVVVTLGVNDLLRIRRPRIFQRDMHRLVRGIHQELGPVSVVLTGLPPMRRLVILPQPLRAVIALRARALDHGVRAVAARVPGVRYVPIESSAWPPGGEEWFFAADRFHPSSEGYRTWAEVVADDVAIVAQEVVSRRGAVPR